MKVSSGSLEEGVKRSMSVPPREGDKYQSKRLRISDQSSWSCTSSSDERAKRIGTKYRKRSEDSAGESFETPTGKIGLRAKEEDGGDRENRSREPRVSSQKGRSVARQSQTYRGEANSSPSGMAWSANKEAKNQQKEKKEPGRGGDHAQWKKWKGDWRSHTVEVVRGAGKGDRRGVRRTVEDSLSPRYKKDSGSR